METIYTYDFGTLINIFYKDGYTLQARFVKNRATDIDVSVDGELLNVAKNQIKNISKKEEK